MNRLEGVQESYEPSRLIARQYGTESMRVNFSSDNHQLSLTVSVTFTSSNHNSVLKHFTNAKNLIQSTINIHIPRFLFIDVFTFETFFMSSVLGFEAIMVLRLLLH